MTHQENMKYLFVGLILLACSCNQQQSAKHNNTAASVTTAKACRYDQKKIRCNKLFVSLQQHPSKQSAALLTNYIADSLIACWYGTPWDFNGCTLNPGQGKIACGYFITTVLQDAGLHINRIKMAQCPSSKLIQTMCSNIRTYSNKPMELVENDIRKMGTGLYIAGLDYHTGFIYNDGRDVYFIHASFYGAKCVVKEKAITAAVLQQSKLKMIGKVDLNQQAQSL